MQDRSDDVFVASVEVLNTVQQILWIGQREHDLHDLGQIDLAKIAVRRCVNQALEDRHERLLHAHLIKFLLVLWSPIHVLRRERRRIHVDRARRIECARVK